MNSLLERGFVWLHHLQSPQQLGRLPSSDRAVDRLNFQFQGLSVACECCLESFGCTSQSERFLHCVFQVAASIGKSTARRCLGHELNGSAQDIFPNLKFMIKILCKVAPNVQPDSIQLKQLSQASEAQADDSRFVMEEEVSHPSQSFYWLHVEVKISA